MKNKLKLNRSISTSFILILAFLVFFLLESCDAGSNIPIEQFRSNLLEDNPQADVEKVDWAISEFDGRVLYLSKANLTDISALSGLQMVEKIHLSNNNIMDLSPLSEMKLVEELYLSENPFSDISSLGEIRNLRILDIAGTNVSDITPLENNRNLRQIDISSTKVQNISPIFSLDLEALSLFRTDVIDLGPFAENENLVLIKP